MSDETKIDAETAKTNKPADAQLSEEDLSKATGGTDISPISIVHHPDAGSAQ
jgi:hypothetical protein